MTHCWRGFTAIIPGPKQALVLFSSTPEDTKLEENKKSEERKKILLLHDLCRKFRPAGFLQFFNNSYFPLIPGKISGKAEIMWIFRDLLLSEISGLNPETFLWFIALHVPGVVKL